MDPDSADALVEAFEAFEKSDARVGVLWGAGGSFCAGWDLKYAASMSADERANIREFDFPIGSAPAPRGSLGPTRMELTKPVIAAVEGPAVAGGMELAMWCDIRVMSEAAYFGVFCRRWGIPLQDGGAVRLPRLVGQGKALEIAMTGRKVPAAKYRPMNATALACVKEWFQRVRRLRPLKLWRMRSPNSLNKPCWPTAVRSSKPMA